MGLLWEGRDDDTEENNNNNNDDHNKNNSNNVETIKFQNKKTVWACDTYQ